MGDKISQPISDKTVTQIARGLPKYQLLMPHFDSRCCHQGDSAWHEELEFTVGFLVKGFH